jgi:(2S)-methylsuccinyl-CoA dehydrogenase
LRGGETGSFHLCPRPHSTSIEAADLVDRAQRLIDAAVRELKARGGVDLNQTLAYDIAHAASAIATARSALDYARRGTTEAALAGAFLGLALSDLATRILGREALWAVADDWYRPFASFVASHRDPQLLASLAETPGPRHLGEDFSMVAEMFHRFAEEQVRPHAEHVHRTNGDIPDSIISGLSELGGFGLSVPEEFGGFATGGESEYLGMVVATEELSWGGLGIGGSLITRPEIIARALLSGGTRDQKETLAAAARER